MIRIHKTAPFLLTIFGALSEQLGAPISAVFCYSLCMAALYVQFFYTTEE